MRDTVHVRSWIVAIVVGACGSSGQHAHDAALADTPVDPGPIIEQCAPLEQVGCGSGEKCTWIIDVATPELIGHTDCAPAGNVALGGACAFGPPGPAGFDDCMKGLVCNEDVCKQLCDVAAGALLCPAGTTCQGHEALFSSSFLLSSVGVCEPVCDPLADNDSLGSGTRAGSACGASFGCYGYPTTSWTCERELEPTLVHGSPCSNTNGCAGGSNAWTTAYLDGCAQGYVPLVTDHIGSTEVECVALCAPGNTFAGNPGTQYPVGKSPHTCTSTDARGRFDTSSNGDQCTYSWWFQRVGGNFVRSATSDTVGVCIDHSIHRYDSNGDGVIDASDAAWPPCASLPDGFGSNGAPGAADFGCVDTAHAGLPFVRRNLVDVRLR